MTVTENTNGLTKTQVTKALKVQAETEKKPTKVSSGQIHLEPIKTETIFVDIVGLTPLITHRWSEKAMRIMLAKQQGIKLPTELRDPDEEYESSIYRLSYGGYGFPVLAFKAATVAGARLFGKEVTMASLKPQLRFHADDAKTGLVEIKCEEGPIMRTDMVRIGPGTADLRFRAEYSDWSARLCVEFPTNAISTDSVVALIDAGGRSGVGEWRAEKDGIYGSYTVVAEAL